jgi:NTP pyrophosphatase (non-canonical NTP hydrolase)
MSQDAFNAIFNAIEAYHKDLGYPQAQLHKTMRMAVHRDLCLALHAEVAELLDAAPWKPWRPEDYKPMDYDNLREELIDVLFFLGSVCELWGLSPTHLAITFEKKLEENKRRILAGYNKPRDDM